MPKRNSINSEQPPATNLRRSPRFFHITVTNSEDPKTPKTKSSRALKPPATNLRRSPRFFHITVAYSEDTKTPKTKSSRARINPPSAPSFSSTQKVSAREDSNSCPEKDSKRVNESGTGRKESLRPDIGARRSARLTVHVEDYGYMELSPVSNVERRVTRSSVRGKTDSDILKSFNGKLKKRATCSFRRGTTYRDVKKTGYDKNTEVLDENEPSTLRKGNAGKYAQKSAHGKYDGFDASVSDQFLDRGVPLTVAVIEGRGKRDEENNEELVIGVKRKRNPSVRSHSIVHGWSKDQELALDRAYFATKPTPHFWKKVAKLVPGKSAQDCFNKVHSDHMTPPQVQPRSRAKIICSPPNSLSASKLLNSSSPIVKRARQRKKSRHLVQKTVRHLLQKQCQVDQNSDEDLFSVLEPRISPSAQSIQQDQIKTTPDNKQDKSNLLKRCWERSSSAKKKSLSRFSGLSGTNLVSPLVLKQVKNKALHEKYVDLLHYREANRKLASVKAVKSKGVKEENRVQNTNAIKAAKNALVFEASDAIKQFQNSQANALMNSFSDDEDGADYNDDDEVEDV